MDDFIDHAFSTTAEVLKTIVQETAAAGQQLVLLVSLFILGFFPRGSLKYQMERKHRIRRRRAAVYRPPEKNVFSSIYYELQNNVSTGPGSEAPQSEATEPPTEDSVVSNASSGVDQLSSDVDHRKSDSDRLKMRARLPPVERFTVRSKQDAVYVRETLGTGLVEDIVISSLMAIEKVTNVLRFSWKACFACVRWFSFFGCVRMTYSIATVLLDALRRAVTGAGGNGGDDDEDDDDIGGDDASSATPPRDGASAGALRRVAPSFKAARLDVRNIGELIEDAGYPFECVEVTTEDGYILSLERIPRRKTRKAVLLQHGVNDSSYTWIAAGTTGSLAFRLYDQGYDVWLGNFRGSTNSQRHEDPNISAHHYWDFCVDDVAMYDMPAFVSTIHDIKATELDHEFAHMQRDMSPSRDSEASSSSPTPPLRHPQPLDPTIATSPIVQPRSRRALFQASVASGAEQPTATPERARSPRRTPHGGVAQVTTKLTVVAHSMGAGVLLMYLVRRRLQQCAHGVERAILLSPAGVFKTAPPFVRYCFIPMASLVLWLCPWINTISLNTPTMRRIISKLLNDVRSHSAAQSVFLNFVTWSLGGSVERHPFSTIHNLAFHVLGSSTARRVFFHFKQMYTTQSFRAYDYGARRNVEVYGTRTPLDYMRWYSLIDIPVHFGMGLRDRLIEPVSVIKQYQTLLNSGGEAYLKAFPNCGHIELTLALNDEACNYIVECIATEGENERSGTPQALRA